MSTPTNPDGYYYLHTNGELIFKRFEPEADSPFVKAVWVLATRDRANAWTILLEALALGASVERIRGLAQHWHCDEVDLTHYMLVVVEPSKAAQEGLPIFIEEVLRAEAGAWFDWLRKTPKGEKPDFLGSPTRKVPE